MAVEINFKKPKLHIFICVNDRGGDLTKPSCGPKISYETFKEVKAWINENNLNKEVYCTRTHCLGFCNPKGGVIFLAPKMKYFLGIKSSEEIIQIIKEEI